jgi:hypothetical protein
MLDRSDKKVTHHPAGPLKAQGLMPIIRPDNQKIPTEPAKDHYERHHLVPRRARHAPRMAFRATALGTSDFERRFAQ